MKVTLLREDRMRKLTLILGGARSGKSEHARRLAEERGGRVLYLATAEAGDDDMRARIEKHRSGRPTGWTMREIPRGIAAALEKEPLEADVVVLDCLTLLVSNAMLPSPLTARPGFLPVPIR